MVKDIHNLFNMATNDSQAYFVSIVCSNDKLKSTHIVVCMCVACFNYFMAHTVTVSQATSRYWMYTYMHINLNESVQKATCDHACIQLMIILFRPQPKVCFGPLCN